MKERSLVRKIYLDSTIKKVDRKVKLLGIHCKYDPIDLLNIRLLICLFILAVCLIFFDNGFILGPILVLLFHYLSEYFVLDLPIKKRCQKLEEEASELAEEFQKSLNEMKMGKSFPEAMTDMKARIPSDTINNAILNIVQASVFGNNIEESLNNQLDFLRDKRLLEIKGKIGKLPTKISVISVVFFIPIILLVILSPVLIDFVMK